MIINNCLTLAISVLMLTGCKKESSPVVPEIQVSSIEVVEGNSGTTKATLSFTLSAATSASVSFNYTTVDASAKAGIDYTAVTGGLVSFAAGEKVKTVDLIVIPNTYMEFDKTFSIKVENIKNATMTYPFATVTIKNDDSYTPESTEEGFITPNNYPGMNLVWSDEFNDTNLNSAFWTCEKGAGGWGNNELEEYTDSKDNAYVENGALTIKAIKTGSNSYTSARIITSGKKEFTYGRIDIRAKLPLGKGIWPALWMLGSNISTVNWPACGEIDIMELLGHEPNKVYGTAHYDEGGHQYHGDNITISDGNFSDKYHIFTIMWQQNSIIWYVDYQKYYQFTRVGEPFNKPFFFIMNVAVGGNWPGNPDNTTVFPQTMTIDYIRVFQ